MTLQQIIDKYNNKFWKVLPNTLPPQCFDLATGITDNLGVPHYPNNPSPFPYANAYQIYTDFSSWQAQYFDRIANSPTGVPQAGDIIVWSNAYGSAGHVAVATGVGNTDTFQAFSQNDPFGSPCILKTYNYNCVLGWLRCKIPQTTPTIPPGDDCPLKLTQVTQERDRLNDVIGLKDKEISSKDSTIQNLNSTIENKNSQIAGLEAEKKALAEQLVTCQQTSDLHLEQAKKVSELTNLYQAQEKSIQSLKAEITLKAQTIGGLQGKWDMIKLPYTKLLKKLLIDRLG